MEKTAVEEAINKFDNLDPNQEFTAQEVVNILLELLPKERQQIEDSFNSGKRNVFGKTCFLIKDGIDYFTQTYTQK